MTADVHSTLTAHGLRPESFSSGQWSAIVNAAHALYAQGHIVGFNAGFNTGFNDERRFGDE